MLLIAPLPTQAKTESPPPPVGGQSPSRADVSPADVLARVGLLSQELELIRFELGRARDRPSEIVATSVAPREVMFQAFTLYRKANQLRFEMTGHLAPHLNISLPSEIRPSDVLETVNLSYGHVLVARRTLGITERVKEKPRDPSTTPTDVFRAIVETSRELGALLRQPLNSVDVYSQVMLASAYADRLLGRIRPGAMIPNLPAFERRKRPIDVYNLLVESYAMTRSIAASFEIETMELEVPQARDPREIRPSEAHDIATIILSELSYIHSRFGSPEPLFRHEAGFKLPSHVYRKAQLLHLQLQEIDMLLSANPDLGEPPGIRLERSL